MLASFYESTLQDGLVQEFDEAFLFAFPFFNPLPFPFSVLLEPGMRGGSSAESMHARYLQFVRSSLAGDAHHTKRLPVPWGIAARFLPQPLTSPWVEERDVGEV